MATVPDIAEPLIRITRLHKATEGVATMAVVAFSGVLRAPNHISVAYQMHKGQSNLAQSGQGSGEETLDGRQLAGVSFLPSPILPC